MILSDSYTVDLHGEPTESEITDLKDFAWIYCQDQEKAIQVCTAIRKCLTVLDCDSAVEFSVEILEIDTPLIVKLEIVKTLAVKFTKCHYKNDQFVLTLFSFVKSVSIQSSRIVAIGIIVNGLLCLWVLDQKAKVYELLQQAGDLWISQLFFRRVARYEKL